MGFMGYGVAPPPVWGQPTPYMGWVPKNPIMGPTLYRVSPKKNPFFVPLKKNPFKFLTYFTQGNKKMGVLLGDTLYKFIVSCL